MNNFPGEVSLYWTAPPTTALLFIALYISIPGKASSALLPPPIAFNSLSGVTEKFCPSPPFPNWHCF